MTTRAPAKWTAKQRQTIRQAFGRKKRRSNTFGIVQFIERAAAYQIRLDNNPATPPSQVRKELECADKAVTALASVLDKLSEESIRRIVLAGVVEKIDVDASVSTQRDSVDASWIGKRLAIDAIKASLGILQKHLTAARAMSAPSRGERAADVAALDLAVYLFVSWLLVFGSKGSTNKNSEFHLVADSVAKLYGLKIGPRVLAKADTDRTAL